MTVMTHGARLILISVKADDFKEKLQVDFVFMSARHCGGRRAMNLLERCRKRSRRLAAQSGPASLGVKGRFIERVGIRGPLRYHIKAYIARSKASRVSLEASQDFFSIGLIVENPQCNFDVGNFLNSKRLCCCCAITRQSSKRAASTRRLLACTHRIDVACTAPQAHETDCSLTAAAATRTPCHVLAMPLSTPHVP